MDRTKHNKAKKTEDAVLELLNRVRPYIQMHNGDVQLLSVEKGVVTLKISGACVGCALADITYNKMIGGLLKEEIPQIKKVVFET